MEPSASIPRRILVIDDDPAYGRSVYRALQKSGFEAFHALTGKEGLTQAKSLRPHAILLDIHLPDIDGIEIYRELKKEIQTQAIPILLLTGLDLIENIREAISDSLDAEDVFQKKEGLQTLIGRVKKGLAGHVFSPPVPAERQLLRRGKISADLLSQRVWLSGKEMPPLGARSFALLCVFLRKKGPIDRLDILRMLWPEKGNVNLLEVAINRLRQVLERSGAGRIDTTPHGYELICDS